ncbi:hypothetical protein CF087_17855 [Clostridium botulinum]|nr:hypothetical protein [Clostridium botulinum]
MIKIIKWICEWSSEELKPQGTVLTIGRLHIFKGLWSWKTFNIQGFKKSELEKQFDFMTPYYAITIGKIKFELWKNKKDDPFKNVTIISEKVLI